MPEYRRAFVPGGTFFLTLVTHQRKPLFRDEANVDRLRRAIAEVRRERPFEIVAAVVLPDHCHFIWELPPDDTDFSKRMGRMKALFTKSLVHAVEEDGGQCPPYSRSVSRVKHREGAVWQRRFWEHTIRDGRDFERHVDYIHYNPVRHEYAACPHLWPHSSVRKWVERGMYEERWCCVCDGRDARAPVFERIEGTAGE